MAQHLTIVMAQLNFLVGDIEGNTDLVIENAERAIYENSADLIVILFSFELLLVFYLIFTVLCFCQIWASSVAPAPCKANV